MPFRETCPVEERIALFREYESGGVHGRGAVPTRYGISRETFYVWKRRRESGRRALVRGAEPRAGHCPHATPPASIAAIVAHAPALPALRAEEDQGAGSRRERPDDRLAGRLDDRRHPEARRPGRSRSAAPAPCDRRRARWAPARTCPTANGRSTSRAGSAPRRHALRSADGIGHGEPLSDRGADHRPDAGGREALMERVFERDRAARCDPLRQRLAVRIDRRGRALAGCRCGC